MNDIPTISPPITEELFMQYMREIFLDLPEIFRNKMTNLSILVQDDPTSEQIQKNAKDGLLLGLYEGIPTPTRAFCYNFCLPDKITLFRNNILWIAETKQRDVKDMIREVVYHEIGHHFGFEEEDLTPYKTV